MKFIEYIAPGGERWRVERGVDLLEWLGIFEGEAAALLPVLHREVEVQEKAWWVVCRVYAVTPLMGVEDPEEMRPWSEEEVAKAEKKDAAWVRANLNAVKEHWERVRRVKLAADAKAAVKPVAASREETEAWDGVSGVSGDYSEHGLGGVGSSEGMRARKREEEDGKLRSYGFFGVEDELERAYILDRLETFAPYLESGQTRAQARSAIQMEIQIFFSLEPSMTVQRRKVREAEKAGQATKSEQEALGKLEKRRQEAQGTLKELMESLGMTEEANPTLAKRLKFKETVAQLIQAVQDYYSEGDRQLVDGMFTAAEVELLLKPMEMRPPQYRADIVLSGWEAIEELWNKEYVPTPIARKVQRRLAKAFRAAVEASKEEGEEVGDPLFDGEGGEEGEALEVPASEPAPQVTLPQAQSTQPVAMPPVLAVPGRSGGVFMT